MKKKLVSLAILLGSVALQAQTIQEAVGWTEAASVKWTPVAGASRYDVYVTGGGLTNQKIGDPLIRQYASGWRADIPGLKAGSYTIKVAPVVSGKEGAGTTSAPVTVTSHDRSGFAFSGGRTPGAYKLDGTPMTGAVILYVTQNSKDTVSMSVVTGSSSTTCKGLQTILDAYKKGKDDRPLIIRIVGTVTDPSYLLGGDLVIENSNLATGHVTLEGIGDDAVVNGWGIRVKNASNVEIRNLAVMLVDSDEGDDIGLQQGNDHVWVHNCDLFYGLPGSDADQVKGDGSLDCKKSTDVTFSYNHFWDNGKSNLLGLSEGDTSDLHITYHHNWYDHSDSRHPRVRYYSAHVYNNYYDGNSKYGVGSTLGSSVFVEANYFRNCKHPMLTAGQGTDLWTGTAYDHASKGTFSGENGGTIKAWNNHIEGAERFAAYGNDSFPGTTAEFDAYVVAKRTDLVPATVKAYKGGAIYNNFDMNSSTMYSYTPDAPEAAKTKVVALAGRIGGGDFKWTFDNAVDDSDAGLNAPLKAALVAYKSGIVHIQGEGSGPVAIAPRTVSSANPIRFDVRTARLVAQDGVAMHMTEIATVDGRIVSRIHGSDVSLKNLARGLYLARVATDRGVFEQIVLKSN